jgi:superfamily II DNA or RNA helicase
MSRPLSPVINCKVQLANGMIGLVREVHPQHSPQDLLVLSQDGEKQWVKLSDVQSGFSINNYVIHHPPQGTGASLGFGQVQAVRSEMGLTQMLVRFADTGESRWLDWRILGHAVPVEARIAKRIVGKYPNHGERFRLRTLSKSLQIWDTNTGALGRLDIDPLPHQLDVARKVVSSPQARWILADDVGLGKTIEVGLILHALEQRNRCRRILIICPASLTKQWKEEMRFKFSRSFEIYNRDFFPEFIDEMQGRENVIASLDLAKRDEHLSMLLRAGKWDVVIFDEAHRLGKGEGGEQTARYKLAMALRDRTASLLLLTATPHQGKTKRFAALLELVRPDLKQDIRTIEINPEIVGEIIIRNKKSRVTDAEGNLLFRGHDTLRYMAHKNEAMQNADVALTEYLRKGYQASHHINDQTLGRAIGFVMTTYRKLASSSVAAIQIALERRLQRLLTGEKQPNVSMNFDDDVEVDDELSQNDIITDVPQFFDDEISQITNLIDLVKEARRDDNKLNTFLNQIVAPLLAGGQKLLIFTEYRATQEYLRSRLLKKFPNLRNIEVINGSMNLDEKMTSVYQFNDGDSQIMVSTEAGGEGLNLQRTCHVMVNYDLPWNPSRLVQRIGRLYRYGQTRRVQVINLQTDDHFDNQALSLMLDRVATMAYEMAAVANENREALAAEILGELLSNIDMEEILERSENLTLDRSEAEITEAIEKAKRARSDEEDVLQFSSNFNTRIVGGFEQKHLVSFVEGMAIAIGIRIRSKQDNGLTIELELPTELVGRWAEFGRKGVIKLSADHDRNQRNRDLVPMDLECSFVLELVSLAQDRVEFDGLYAESLNQSAADMVSLHQVRWQGLSGETLEEELFAISATNGRYQKLEHKTFADLLLNPWTSSKPNREDKLDEKCNGLANGLIGAVERILKTDVSASKSPLSVFTYAACFNPVMQSASVMKPNGSGDCDEPNIESKSETNVSLGGVIVDLSPISEKIDTSSKISSPWSQERVNKLTEMWREGYSANQIAKALGNVSRNAVIGKVKRVGLMSRREGEDSIE